ncbi:unnamed protein product [Rotaria sp. Silwood1]|nr:unnamed protein product [Rotaria sp. Silwood1]
MVSNNIKIETFFVHDDGQYFPNNNHLSVIVYRQVFDSKTVSASKWEQLFKENNFGKSWRDGIFSFHHYHSTAHEALGCYDGRAQVRLGGDNEQVRKDIELVSGDCILIPVGVAHKNIGQDNDFAVVGAYDIDGKNYDMNYGKNAEERRKAEENIKQTSFFIDLTRYIRDNQVYGDCTPETYIHALRTGCRAVEMDCYDGDNMEPIVYHGNTLTKPIPFREIILAIKTEAFTTSPYPLFFNIENHCSYEQQDHLLSKPLVDDYEKLPSPEELKYKVIIRSRRYPKGKIAADPKSDRSNDETEPNPKDYHPDFSNLIIYSQIVSFMNIIHTIYTQKCFHSISFKESKADDLINQPSPEHLDLIKLTKQHMVRVYPGTKRQDSSNIDPVDYWTYGVQMVALNYQANDKAMCIQRAFFSDNGGCGYLLKPSFLLSDNQLFDPKDNNHKKGKHIQIHIISGQHLPKEKNHIEHTDIVDPYVTVITYGIKSDCTEHNTPSVRNNGLNPIWDYKINLDIFCPELCLILFQVRDKDRYGPSTFLGQACVPFTALQLGYRHIKLKAKDGDYIQGTIFVHIKIEDF